MKNTLSVLVFIFAFSFTVSSANLTKGSGDTIKILAIGNSFSADALEHYLHDIAKSAGKNIIIGNLYIGGCSLETHLNNIKENKNAYRYWKRNNDGEVIVTENVKMSNGLKDENWDIISFQQASPLSGKYATWQESLPELYEVVKDTINNKDAKYIIHQTWAYQQDSDHSGFANYNNSQKLMYDSIVSAVDKSGELINADFIVPVGIAIQIARSSKLGDTLCKDGYHLNENYGQFTAAATWFEKLFNEDVRRVKFTPANVTKSQAKISKSSAHKAIEKHKKMKKKERKNKEKK